MSSRMITSSKARTRVCVISVFRPSICNSCMSGIPDMQLLQIDGLKTEITQTLVRAFDDVIIREDILDVGSRSRGPNLIFRWNFRGYVDSLSGVFHHSAD